MNTTNTNTTATSPQKPSSSSSSSSSHLKTWERRIAEAKRKHRPRLKNWSKDGFHESFRRGPDFERLRNETLEEFVNQREIPRPPPTPTNPTPHPTSMTTIDRISCRNMTPAQFINGYEKPGIPCIITDIPTVEQWPACEKWTFHRFCAECFTSSRNPNTNFGERYFKVGEDDEGYKVKVRFRYFLRYLCNNTDDSPLYIFDSNYDNDAVAKSLLGDYRVPTFFPDDLFSLVGEKRRPPYRWFLCGPQRSGTCVHVDPLGTSAWNTVLEGRKRWVLIPPQASKSTAKGVKELRQGEDDEAVNYFVDIIPRMRKRLGASMPIIEFVQRPGDTVFVPGGWWHGVLNLDDTIAITQNYCSRANFERVWLKTRSGRKKMSVKWLRELRKEYPLLANQAEELNQRDEFTMLSLSDRDAKKEGGRKKGEKKEGEKKEEKRGRGGEMDRRETDKRESKRRGPERSGGDQGDARRSDCRDRDRDSRERETDTDRDSRDRDKGMDSKEREAGSDRDSRGRDSRERDAHKDRDRDIREREAGRDRDSRDRDSREREAGRDRDRDRDSRGKRKSHSSDGEGSSEEGRRGSRGAAERGHRRSYERSDRGSYERDDRRSYERVDRGPYERDDRRSYERGDRGSYVRDYRRSYERGDKGSYERGDRGSHEEKRGGRGGCDEGEGSGSEGVRAKKRRSNSYEVLPY